jgi:glutamate-1-semialdehyde 2,1-aminomutase
MTDLAQLMPGGSLGSHIFPTEFAFVVSHGSGSKVFDLEGNEYLDYILGSGPLFLGHAHPSVVSAVQDQVGRGSQFYWATEQPIELARLMVDAIPCAELVKFSSSGAEATFYAIRLARAFTGRDLVLRFKGSYHGHHDYGVTGASAGIPEAIEELVLHAPYNDLEAVRGLVDEHGDNIAAIIVEPMQRIIRPREGFLEGLRELASSSGAILIFDEVVTGFRLAWGGGQEHYGVVPDLATYGKVIGGGYPLSAVAGRGDVMELSSPLRRDPQAVYFSGTLNANPIVTAAGLATLRELQETNPYERVNAAADKLRAGLREVISQLDRPAHVLGDGPVLGIAFADGDPTDPAILIRNDQEVLSDLETALFRRGIMNNIKSKLYMSVAHDNADIERTIDAVRDALLGGG